MSTPKKRDEWLLWQKFGNGTEHYRFPADAAKALFIPEKRMIRLCEKWARNGIYEWGTWVGYGWKREGQVGYSDLFRRYWLNEGNRPRPATVTRRKTDFGVVEQRIQLEIHSPAIESFLADGRNAYLLSLRQDGRQES